MTVIPATGVMKDQGRKTVTTEYKFLFALNISCVIRG